MDIPAAKTASDLLVRCWREGDAIAALPVEVRPRTRAEGYLVQAQIEARSDRPLLGWKIAATSVAGQRHIGVDGPLAGRLLAEWAHGDGDTAPFGANRMRVAEAEFAFRVGRDLPPRAEPYALDEVMAAVDALFLAIEIPDSRYVDFVTAGGPQLIADNACAHRFVLGPEAPPEWRALDLAAHRVVGTVEGRASVEGRGANVLGDPRIALAWLANELSAIDETLRAGQIVTTGTCVTPMAISPGDRIVADFGALGRVSCRVA
jgi:2-keto-4-pentenoate hydratase